MVSKEELRKLNKEQLVDLVYDLLIRVDKLTAEVHELRQEVQRLKTPKTVATVPFLLLMTCFGSRIKAFGKKAIKNLVVNPDTKEKHSLCHLIPTK